MTETTQLQQLNQAMADKRWSQAATLGFALAGQGGLPIIELFGLAQELTVAGDVEQAIALYRLWLKHTDTPLAYAGHFNLAVVLMQSGDLGAAEQAFRKTISLNPEFIEAYLNLGTLHERRQEPERALSVWRRALALIHPALPNSATLYLKLLNNLARLLEHLERYAAATDMLSRSLQLDPQQPLVLAHWIQLRQRQCIWPVQQALAELDQADLEQATSPLATLALSDDPDVQLAAAQRYAKEKVLAPAKVAPLAGSHGYVHQRLRIGYLSSDFCSHAVAILLAELFELHDRAATVVYGFCWSPEDGSALRARLTGAMDHHVSIAAMSDQQAAFCIRSHEIDILVDLHGLTHGLRPDILSYRPAPVQIAWLGYPGSSGLPAIDYVLADDYVLPPALAPFYTEQPLYLPDTFQINDRKRLVGAPLSRAACGLPEDAFVFCSFNRNQKITPEVYGSWMCILQRVPDSILWLLADHEQVRNNLLGAAAAYGVPASRLFFAERIAAADNLARYQLADLFLDTYPYNAGATASDALWAGLPLLTRSGHSYAARMAGSVLRAAGLDELITDNREDYIELAVALARAPARLAALRERLRQGRDSCALFDTPRFVRNLEQAYRRVARGEVRGNGKRRAPVVTPPSVPLVSILMPTRGSKELEPALLSALGQSYGNCEIIISDCGATPGPVPKVAKYLKRHPQLRYVHAPGLTPQANLDNCLAQASGEYVSFLMEGELLHPEKIGKMMHFYRSYPNTGLVTSFRQSVDQPQQSGLFAIDTAITGVSLGSSILSGASKLAGELSAMLLRREGLSAALGQYQGRRYAQLDAVATALSMLGAGDCIYLSAALTSYRAPAPLPDHDPLHIAAGIEWLRLLYDAHRQQRYLTDPVAFRTLLAARLAAFANHVALHHQRLRDDACDIEEIHLVLRQGYQLLLTE